MMARWEFKAAIGLTVLVILIARAFFIGDQAFLRNVLLIVASLGVLVGVLLLTR